MVMVYVTTMAMKVMGLMAMEIDKHCGVGGVPNRNRISDDNDE